jgi:hypothetical protein
MDSLDQLASDVEQIDELVERTRIANYLRDARFAPALAYLETAEESLADGEKEKRALRQLIRRVRAIQEEYYRD